MSNKLINNIKSSFHFGLISILSFLIYFLFLQFDKYFDFNLNTIMKILFSLCLIVIGIITGYFGMNRNIQKKASITGLILNTMALIFFSVGLVKGFLS